MRSNSVTAAEKVPTPQSAPPLRTISMISSVPTSCSVTTMPGKRSLNSAIAAGR